LIFFPFSPTLLSCSFHGQPFKKAFSLTRFLEGLTPNAYHNSPEEKIMNRYHVVSIASLLGMVLAAVLGICGDLYPKMQWAIDCAAPAILFSLSTVLVIVMYLAAERMRRIAWALKCSQIGLDDLDRQYGRRGDRVLDDLIVCCRAGLVAEEEHRKAMERAQKNAPPPRLPGELEQPLRRPNW
jgi:hypothetical protein